MATAQKGKRKGKGKMGRGRPPKDTPFMKKVRGKNNVLAQVQDYTDDIEWYLQYAYMQLDYEEALEIFRSNKNSLKEAINFNGEPDKDLLRFFRDPENFGIAVYYLFGITLLPFQVVVLQTLFYHPFPLLMACRGGSKTFLLGVFLVLMSILYQGTKIIMVGVAFRQARLIFEVMEKIWDTSPILQDLVGDYNKAVTYKQNDRWSMYLGDSQAHALPIGSDGSTIRGFRSNITVADEFQSQNPVIYEEVISGFSSVSQDPIQKVMDATRREFLIKVGRWDEEQEKLYKEGKTPNRQIISGTADYEFGHFCKYFQKYTRIIKSKGNLDEIKDLVPEKDQGSFNWKDYAIIRIPYELFPPSFMDITNINRSRLTLSNSLFKNEFHCCTTSETLVLTNSGPKKIENIKINDMVLTHKGRFRKVTEKMVRWYDGDIVDYKTYGYNKNINMTPEHPFWIGGNNWTNISDLENETCLSNLKELSGKSEIDLREFISQYSEAVGLIYPTRSKSKFSREIIRKIGESTGKIRDLAKKLGMLENVVGTIKRKYNKKRYNSIPPVINLDYDFGIIVGYYASEGSTGSFERQTAFSLDGHIDLELKLMVSQLKNSIFKVFGIEAKEYWPKDSCVSVTVNNKFFAELMKFICPGLSETKVINSSILYSNKDFLKGFIEGYWNGDGHISSYSQSSSASIDLTTQIKIALSYFDISSTFQTRPPSNSFIGNREIKSNEHYQLVLNGNNQRKLENLIRNTSCDTSTNYQQKIINDGEKTSFKFINKKYREYKGLVYNLEVEEDYSYSLMNATVHNCFSKDSGGFYKMSLIKECTCTDMINLPSGPVKFSPIVKGDLNKKYVYGIDPAQAQDNLAIVILELHGDHRRVVYCWTTNNENHKEKVKLGIVHENEYFSYVARKIRTLMETFPPEVIAIDSQGGGKPLSEALHDKDKLRPGELPLWEIRHDHVLGDKKEKETDKLAGKHILEMIQFGNAEYTAMSHNGLKKDMEDKAILYPASDPLELAISSIYDEKTDRFYDTLGDCVYDIEQMKEEMATVIQTKTQNNNRDRWDTPETMQDGKKGKLKKDRFSALVIANAAARRLHRHIAPTHHMPQPIILGQGERSKNDQMFLMAPDGLAEKYMAFFRR